MQNLNEVFAVLLISITHEHRGQAEAGRQALVPHLAVSHRWPGLLVSARAAPPAAALKRPIMWHNQIKGRGVRNNRTLSLLVVLAGTTLTRTDVFMKTSFKPS